MYIFKNNCFIIKIRLREFRKIVSSAVGLLCSPAARAYPSFTVNQLKETSEEGTYQPNWIHSPAIKGKKAVDNNKKIGHRGFRFCLGADLSKRCQIWVSHLAAPRVREK